MITFLDFNLPQDIDSCKLPREWADWILPLDSIYSFYYIDSKNSQGGKRMAVISLKDFPDDLHRRTKVQAAKEGITIKGLIIRLLVEYLEKVGG